MKNHIIRVAAAVPELKVGNVKYNTDQIIKMIRELPDCGLIVFPELSVTGYTCADLFLSDLLLQSAVSALPVIAAETGDLKNLVVVGVPIRHENCQYIRAERYFRSVYDDRLSP